MDMGAAAHSPSFTLLVVCSWAGNTLRPLPYSTFQIFHFRLDDGCFFYILPAITFNMTCKWPPKGRYGACLPDPSAAIHSGGGA